MRHGEQRHFNTFIPLDATRWSCHERLTSDLTSETCKAYELSQLGNKQITTQKHGFVRFTGRS